MIDFVAIDFETANRSPLSVCSVGIAGVSGGKVVDVFSTLVRPEPLEFCEDFVALHGITAEMVQSAPLLAQVCDDIRKRCEGRLVVAHNAAFDVRIMKESLVHCGLWPIAGRYMCTVGLAREFLPGLPNHKLPTLATLFGISVAHHDATSDAIACAELAIRLVRLSGVSDMTRYCRDLSDFGQEYAAGAGGLSLCVELSIDDLTLKLGRQKGNAALVETAARDGRFAGKCFVFTGELVHFTRGEVTELVQSQGGRVSGSVSKVTDYVVVADEVWTTFERSGTTTGKFGTALTLQKQGHPIRIIREDEFVRMVQ